MRGRSNRFWLRPVAFVILSAILVMLACGPQPPLAPLVTPSRFDFASALGVNPQALNYHWLYHAGNDVTGLRLDFSTTTLPSGVNLNVLDGSGQLVQVLTGSIGGWSAPIDGNRVHLQVLRGQLGPVPSVVVNQMEYTRRRGPIFPVEPPPGSVNYATARRLSHNVADYGHLRGTDYTNYYVASNLAGKPIDIVVESLDNASLDVYTSDSEFLISPARAVHHAVATNGNPAFIEIDSAPADTMYITVRSTNGSGRYYIMTNHVRQKFWLSFEFEGNNFWNRTAPNGQTYFDLVRALAADASRELYDATDGMMRFDVITIYKTERDFTVGDVYIHDEVVDPENANSWDIDIGRNTLESSDGGWTIVHEWGHYQWGLPDEYERDPTNFQCPNSRMSTTLAQDFCVDANHDPRGELGGDSMWKEIWSQYASTIEILPGVSVPWNDPNGLLLKTDTPGAERFRGLNLTPFILWRIFE